MSVQHHNPSDGRGPATDRRLRVAVVTSSYNYIRDGVALTLNRLVAYLERHGVEVLVFAPVGKTAAVAHAGTLVPVPSMPLPPRPEYRLAFGLSRRNLQTLDAFQPDLMHLALAPDLLGYSAIRAARRRRIPLVASCHTRFDTYLKHYPYTTWAENILKAYLRFAYGAAREVYVPSQSMLEALVADGVKTVFRLWPRGVDTDLFHPEKRSPAFRAAYGIGENEFLIAFVSRLVREKNLETVIATVRLLASRGIAHRMIFVGDGPERALLEKELPNAVFTGFLTNEDLAAAYASSDVFLFPSETETFGSVTLEAMASGLPCVCANATGSRSLVLQDKTGNLVEPYDTETFADRIALLAQSPELRARFGAAARTRSLSFSWDESMALLLGHYRSLVAGAAA